MSISYLESSFSRFLQEIPWMMVVTFFGVAGFTLFPGNRLSAEVLIGRVTHVRDGDTIEVSGRPIRLNGLTCDEKGKPLGDQATRTMQRLVISKILTCGLNGERTYDREVGRCYLPDGRDIGAVMIELKICGRCARYDPFLTYAKAQREVGPFKGTVPDYCRSR